MSMTVVQTLPALEVGGVERGTLEVARELVKQGHRSIVVSAGGRMVKKLENEGSEHIAWPIGKKSPLTLRYVPLLKKLLREEKVDILHARSRLPGWVSWLAWKGIDADRRPKFVTTVHGPYSVNTYSSVMTKGEKIIAISEYIKKYILDNYKSVNENNITIIHRGVKSEEFPFQYKPDGSWLATWHQQYPSVENKFVITTPARITRWKGQEDFLNIVAGLKKRGVNVHGIIAGAPHPRRAGFLSELQSLAHELNIDKEVSFIGHRDDMRDVMAVSNIVLSLAKEPEAFGRTALEALSLGVPVVAYDHGGASEVLSSLFPQGLVPAHDVEAAILTCESLQQNKPLIPETHSFTLENMLNDTLAVYQRALKQA